MRTITLTTDLDTQEHYVAVLKGRIMTQIPDVQIIDISHHIQKYDINQAAYMIKNSFIFFPEKSIHIISVNTLYKKKPEYLLVEFQNHFFVLPDNGMIDLITGSKPKKVFTLDILPDADWVNFPVADIMLRIAKKVLENPDLEKIGKINTNYEKKSLPTIKRIQNGLVGEIILIDSYQNAITNITKSDFDAMRAGRLFQIFYNRTEYITNIWGKYNAVEAGDALALFDMTNHLQIAVNQGKAAQILGLRINSPITIRFL